MMIDQIDISIIVPIYNAEAYLKECLDSIFNQHFSGTFEAICVYNHSSDNSLEILKEYQNTYENLVIVMQENKEPPAPTRFKGIAKARGKYIGFIDADDKYDPNFLQKMHDEISKGYDVVGCNFSTLTGDIVKENGFKSNKEYNSVQATKALLMDMSVRAFLYTKLFKREFFFNYTIPYPKRFGQLFEDTIIVYKIFLHIKSFKMIKDSLYFYRQIPTSLTATVNLERFNYHLYTFALVRYLADQEENRKYFKVFRSTLWRSKLSLMYDANLLKKELGHGMLKHMKLFKKELKLLANKKPLPIKGQKWEQYINECLS